MLSSTFRVIYDEQGAEPAGREWRWQFSVNYVLLQEPFGLLEGLWIPRVDLF